MRARFVMTSLAFKYCLFNKSEFSIFQKLLEIFERFFLMKVHSKDYGEITKAIQ